MAQYILIVLKVPLNTNLQHSHWRG